MYPDREKRRSHHRYATTTHTIYRAPADSLIVYREGDEVKVAKSGDLTDIQLLLALVNAVQITDFGKK